MFLWYGLSLILIATACIGLQLILKMRSLGAAKATGSAVQGADRYRPMLRLLSDADLEFLPAGSPLRRTLRARRRELFRAYLRCLTRDYARLLAGVRYVMTQSRVDRPDLAHALLKNRVLFALAICKVEYRLALHAAGIGHVEIAGLVEALETLRSQVTVLTPLAQAA
jgi:hypothetical protein